MRSVMVDSLGRLSGLLGGGKRKPKAVVEDVAAPTHASVPESLGVKAEQGIDPQPDVSDANDERVGDPAFARALQKAERLVLNLALNASFWR